MYDKERKFHEAAGICRMFARMSHEDRKLFSEMREKLRDRHRRYSDIKTLLGGKITDELSQKINARLEANAKAYSALKDALYRNDQDEEIFTEARRIVFKVENGNANTLLTELTEMERFYATVGNLDGSQLDMANAPTIRSINGGEYACRSANPSVSSEMRYMCESALNTLRGMKKER